MKYKKHNYVSDVSIGFWFGYKTDENSSKIFQEYKETICHSRSFPGIPGLVNTMLERIKMIVPKVISVITLSETITRHNTQTRLLKEFHSVKAIRMQPSRLKKIILQIFLYNLQRILLSIILCANILYHIHAKHRLIFQ